MRRGSGVLASGGSRLILGPIFVVVAVVAFTLVLTAQARAVEATAGEATARVGSGVAEARAGDATAKAGKGSAEAKAGNTDRTALETQATDQTAAQGQYGLKSEAPGPDAECPGANVVSTTAAAGDAQTAPFEITGERFRVNITFPAGTPQSAFADVTVFNDANDDFVTSISQDGPGTKSSIVNAGPGEFFLDITASTGDDYVITVEDCVDANGAVTNSPDDNGDKDDVIDDTIPNQTLSDTGGPSFGLLMASLLLLGGGLLLRATLRR